MPLDPVARSYADGLLWQELEQQIQKEYVQRMVAVNTRFAGQRSGLYAQEVVKVILWHAEQFIDARKKSLVNAYEKAGLPFDDSSLKEIQSELAIFARAQQGHATSAMSDRLTQMQMLQTDAVKNSLAQQIERGVSGAVAKANRELTLKRQETILDERRAKANPVEEASAAKETPPRKPWDAERLLALAASVVTIWQVVSGSYTVALWFAVVAIGLMAFSFLHRSKPFYFIAAATLIVGCLIQYFLISPRNAPFSAVIEVAISSESNNDSPFVGRFGGNQVTPIPVVMFLRIVNLQNIPSTISELDLQVGLDHMWWGGRHWLNLSLLPSDMPLLYVDSKSNLCSTVTLGGLQLASALGTGVVDAHATIRGWALFDAPAEFALAPRPLRYRILIKDTAGRSLSTVITRVQTNDENLLQEHALHFGPKVQMPTNLVLRHFFY